MKTLVGLSVSLLGVVVGAMLQPALAFGDDTSAADKLRILYANRFTFTDDKLPLITVEIVSGQPIATLSAPGGLVAKPDGESGPAVTVADDAAWVITAQDYKPAIIMEWAVVETLGPDDEVGTQAALAKWKQRGYEPRAFEIGSMFGVDGEVIDSRETRIAIAPVPKGKGAEHIANLSKKLGQPLTLHQELVRRPSGTIVARAGSTVVKNPSVIWFAPANPQQTVTIADVPTGTGGSQLTTSKETRRYWGAVYVTLGNERGLTVVNAVPEDKLLAGIVPSEMFAGAPAAALEAQAIAARTELLQKVGRRNLAEPFLLCSTQQCQVYAGAGKEDPRTTRAVNKTRGMVLLRDGGGMVDVRYSASCGGHSEDNDWIWGGEPDPSLRGRRDNPAGAVARISDAHVEGFLAEPATSSWCGKASMAKQRHRWTVTLSASELTARVAAEFPTVGNVVGLTVKERGVSGRARTLVVKGERGTAEVTGDLRIRRLLGGLKSTLIAIDVQGPLGKPTGFVFRGAGFGHGVGMCQMGAIGMAEASKSYQDILRHYYRGTHVHRLY